MGITITYFLSAQGQRASLLAGGSGKEMQAIEVDNKIDFATAVPLAKIAADGSGKIQAFGIINTCPGMATSYSVSGVDMARYDAPQDVPSLLRDVAAAQAAYAAKVAAHEAATEAEEHARREEAERQAALPVAEQVLPQYNDWNVVSPLASYPELRQAAEKAIDRLRADKAARLAADKAAKSAAAEAAIIERNQWIAAHGSNRLQRSLAEGIECEAVYLSERLKAERDGWTWERKTPGESSEPRNPPLSAFELLEQARAVDPAATLVFWRVENDPDEADECDKYAWTGYAAIASFLDREIVFGVPSEYCD